MQIQRITNELTRHSAWRACRLRVIEGPDLGLEVDIPSQGVIVGAEAPAQVVLTDPAVSRRHCQVIPGPLGFEVADLDSRNGTYLDGVALTRALVPLGSVLRVGNSQLQLMPAEEPMDL